MVGTGGPSPRITLSSDPPPCRMATNAEGRSMAAPQARPECTPIAAYRSLYVAPRLATQALGGDRPRQPRESRRVSPAARALRSDVVRRTASRGGTLRCTEVRRVAYRD